MPVRSQNMGGSELTHKDGNYTSVSFPEPLHGLVLRFRVGSNRLKMSYQTFVERPHLLSATRSERSEGSVHTQFYKERDFRCSQYLSTLWKDVQ